jgi:TonB family protein
MRPLPIAILLLVLPTPVIGEPPACDPVPRLLAATPPEYTKDALAAKVEGDVLLEVTFGNDGQPRSAVVIKGLPLGLNDKAVEAVASWRFATSRDRRRCTYPVRVPFLIPRSR